MIDFSYKLLYNTIIERLIQIFLKNSQIRLIYNNKKGVFKMKKYINYRSQYSNIETVEEIDDLSKKEIRDYISELNYKTEGYYYLSNRATAYWYRSH